MPILEFEKVSKVYSGRRRGLLTTGDHAGAAIKALNEVSLSIAAGQSLGVIGESGAGKTTLAALAVGLTQPTTGLVRVAEATPGTTKASRRRRPRQIQLIWQDTYGAVDPRLRVRQIIAEPLQIHGLPGAEVRESVNRLLTEVGLPVELDGRRPHELSGGELQRVVIARALALDPELLICDEPAAALDAHAKARVAELFVRLQAERGLALMLIAHDLPLVRRITKELIVMHEGAIVERGSTESVIRQPAHPYTKLLISCDPSISMERLESQLAH